MANRVQQRAIHVRREDNQSPASNQEIRLVCLSDEASSNTSVRPEVLEIARVLARIAIDSYIQESIAA